MAKAQFHKNQRVFVRPVGTWALIERVIPQWAKGLEEPIRVFYDVGLGREFGAEELQAEGTTIESLKSEGENWRMVRARNKWQQGDDCGHHPHPGTYPTVVTGDTDWGGWRVPGAEYDLYPERIEVQARLIANAPRMLNALQRLMEFAESELENLPDDLLELAKECQDIIRTVSEDFGGSETEEDSQESASAA